MPLAMDDVLRFLRHTCGDGGGDKTDAELLESYLAHEEVAFSMLVQRHGPMVLGICRRLSADFHAAEDGFQATFMVLARRAASIRKKKSISAWLHGVARRTALKARAKAARGNDKRLLDRASANPLDELTTRELRTLIDEEIAQLTEKYQTPILLCYFAGKSHDQAAKELGCAKNTVTNRLTRARELLRPPGTPRHYPGNRRSVATALTEIGIRTPTTRVPRHQDRQSRDSAGYRQSCGLRMLVSDCVGFGGGNYRWNDLAEGEGGCDVIGHRPGGWRSDLGGAPGIRGSCSTSSESKCRRQRPPKSKPVATPQEDQVAATDRIGDPLPAGGFWLDSAARAWRFTTARLGLRLFCRMARGLSRSATT